MTSTPLDHPPAPGQPAVKPAARWEDFIDIFYAPAAVFRRREKAGFGIPLLVMWVAIAVIVYATYNALSPMYQALMNRALAAAARQNPQAATNIEAAQKVTEAFAKFGGVAAPLTIFGAGFVIWFVGFFFGAKQTFATSIMVMSYATITDVMDKLAMGIQAMLVDMTKVTTPYALQLGPSRFVNSAAMSPYLITFLSRLNVFEVWQTVLIGIAFRVCGKLSRINATLAAVIVWLLVALPQLFGAFKDAAAH